MLQACFTINVALLPRVDRPSWLASRASLIGVLLLQVVNGPEILNKYVGASEENVRNLFADAEKDQAMHGEASELHVIIFDEIDAICKARGSVSSGSGRVFSVVLHHWPLSSRAQPKSEGSSSLNFVEHSTARTPLRTLLVP